MLPEHPALAKCPKCSSLFRAEDAKEVDVGFDAAKGKPRAMAQSEKESAAYLSSETLPKEKEFYPSMRCWWAANDAWLRLTDAKPAYSSEQVKNLDAFSALFDESLPGHRILKAEIAREFERFDEYFIFLSYQFEEGYDWTVGLKRELAEEKLRAVKPFEQGK